MNTDDEMPHVGEIDSQTVLIDPTAVAVIRAVEKHNCKSLFTANAVRIAHFKRRMLERNETPESVVIVILNVDDSNGGVVAEKLMPGYDWQQFRDKGEIPFARGLANREFIQGLLYIIDKEAAVKLQAMTDLAVVVMDRGIAEVFTA